MPNLDKKVEKIINSQTNSSMSTYQKVKALYDWVINDMDYSIPVLNLNEIPKIQNEYGLYESDAIEVYFARDGFSSHSGSCNTYSAMFMILTRRIGLDSYTVGARNVKDGSGRVTVNIKINGVWYDFDTQGEDNSKTKRKINYIFFGKKDLEVKKIYTYTNRNGDVASFKHFKRQNDRLETKVTIGGKTVSAVAYNQTQKVVKELIEVELNKGEPIPIKIESNREVEYNWNDNTYTKGLMYFNDNVLGKVKSGTVYYNLNYFI